jgi:hypothetical protein
MLKQPRRAMNLNSVGTLIKADIPNPQRRSMYE